MGEGGLGQNEVDAEQLEGIVLVTTLGLFAVNARWGFVKERKSETGFEQ